MSQEKRPKVEYVDRPDLEEIFANHVRLCAFEGGIVRVELCVDRQGHDDTTVITRHPAVRFAVHPQTASNLVHALSQLADLLKSAKNPPPTKQ